MFTYRETPASSEGSAEIGPAPYFTGRTATAAGSKTA